MCARGHPVEVTPSLAGAGLLKRMVDTVTEATGKLEENDLQHHFWSQVGGVHETGGVLPKLLGSFGRHMHSMGEAARKVERPPRCAQDVPPAAAALRLRSITSLTSLSPSQVARGLLRVHCDSVAVAAPHVLPVPALPAPATGARLDEWKYVWSHNGV